MPRAIFHLTEEAKSQDATAALRLGVLGLHFTVTDFLEFNPNIIQTISLYDTNEIMNFKSK